MTQQDWHPADIIAALKKRGTSLAALSRKALEHALPVAKQRDGKLIDKPDLKTAMEHWHKQAAKVWLTGECSPHSLRYAWALGETGVRLPLERGITAFMTGAE